ncbi:MAG: hypothetical protein IKP01_02210 [Bacteroidales bacterium]|nr:hypothetical protein [Bacteroidales bacterium]
MLARYMRHHADRLRADFQQYYGLDMDGMGDAYTLSHAACLAAQLPAESRCVRAEHPEFGWSQAEYIAAEIAYGVAVLAWQNTKDGQRGVNMPKRLQTPAQRAEVERKFSATDFDYIDEILKGGGDG